MLLFALASQPMLLIAWVAAIIVALTVHEFSHALAATLLGDETAKMKGRLTLNPIAHISWIGFLMLLVVGFGWGKPVPFNQYNLKFHRFGQAIVAVAGPLSNLISVIIFIIAFVLIFPSLNPLFIVSGTSFLAGGGLNLLAVFLSLLIYLNIILMLFNLIPFSPLDGSKILFAFMGGIKYADIREWLDSKGPIILLTLIIVDNTFNLHILSKIFGVVINFVYNLFA